MHELNEYSIFVTTDAATAEVLRQVICSFADISQTMPFEPHITLLGGIHGTEQDIQEKFSTLAEGGKAFNVPCVGVKTGEQFYKSLYVECENVAPLSELNLQAKKLFESVVFYLPHASLLYGDLSEVKKQELISSLAPHTLPSVYPATGLALWRMQGSVQDWKKLAEIRFS